MMGAIQSAINTIGQSFGNNDVMLNFFKDTIRNKKKVIVDGNEFIIVEPNNIAFDRNGEAKCLMTINGKKVKCCINTNNDTGSIRIDVEDFLENEQKDCKTEEEEYEDKKAIKLKINDKIVKTCSFFYINPDFSISTMPRLQAANYMNNNSLFFPLNGIKSIENMNFYDFDKQTQKITDKKNSICLEATCDDFKFSNEDEQSRIKKDLLEQIKSELSNEHEKIFITFSANPKEEKKVNKNQINDKKENKIEDNIDIVCCSTGEKMIFFKKDQKTNKYVKIKPVLKQTNGCSPVFINKDIVYNLNKKSGVLELYSLKWIEKIATIKLGNKLSKDWHTISRMDAKDNTFIDKKTFENKLKEYMLKNCVSNNIDTINNNSNVNGLNSVQNKKTKCTIF